ncbi:protein CURLY FLAG LEAF 1-like [Curcuma longa]|uniref:protein CURLY FLAG LEAF 1-like n=1 Tax=Curcuma longa TaxID=136217 RepID=UPI003D9E0386
MSAVPNIEMIAASLRSCNLGKKTGGAAGSPSPVMSSSPPASHLLEVSDESAGEVRVELISETAPPCPWEQCLDMRTGEVYYINWETGTRIAKDPRTTADCYQSSNDSCTGVGDGDGYESCVDTANSSCVSSLSSTSPSDSSVTGESGRGQVLVAAGCRSCFMYFMVLKSVDACPKCCGSLLHLGRGGSV